MRLPRMPLYSIGSLMEVTGIQDCWISPSEHKIQIGSVGRILTTHEWRYDEPCRQNLDSPCVGVWCERRLYGMAIRATIEELQMAERLEDLFFEWSMCHQFIKPYTGQNGGLILPAI